MELKAEFYYLKFPKKDYLLQDVEEIEQMVSMFVPDVLMFGDHFVVDRLPQRLQHVRLRGEVEGTATARRNSVGKLIF